MKHLMMTILLGVLSVPAWAQDPGDAPEHGVARISQLSGDVTVRRGDSGEDVAAERNAPLVAQDHVFTAQDSRAEIQFDYANVLRLADESEVRLAELGDRDYLVQLAAGTATFRVLRDSDAQAEISTPTMSIRPREDGIYRITVRDDNSTELTVRSGEAEVYVGGKTDYVRAGQTLLVSGDPSDPQRRYVAAIPRDEWDRWNDSRDRDRERSDSYKYVNRHIYGAEDLSGHGRWVYDPPYGWVWVPRVDVMWAPYRVGRWVWVDFYGWTWVSGDPWGWAPYHYGRWYYASRYGWVWYPGDVHTHYYWRPALVVFFGWGTANVGWVPLAPREVYRPWYGPGRTVVVNNVTVVNNINVVTTYRNARYVSGRNGVTSLGSGDFGRRNITINNYVVANNRDLEHAGDAGRWLPKEPTREHRQFSPRAATAHSVRPDTNRDFVMRPGRSNNGNQARGGDDRPGDRGRGGDARGQQNSPSDNARRGNDSGRNATVTGPRNEQERGRQPDINRGRNDNSRGEARVQPNTPSSNTGRGSDSRRNETVVFPRNEQDRGRQADTGRGNGRENSTTSRPASEPRGGDSRGSNSVTFPRNEQDRGRQADTGRGNGRENPTTSRPASEARGSDSRGNNSVTFPRNDQDRGRQPEITRGRNESSAPRVESNSPRNDRPQAEPNRERNDGFVRAPAEARREPAAEPRGRSSENSRRPEPTVRSAPDNPPQRSEPSRGRGEETVRPQQGPPPESGSSRPQASAPSESRSSGRGNSRSGASSQAPSSSAEGKGEEGSSESSGRGRGRR